MLHFLRSSAANRLAALCVFAVVLTAAVISLAMNVSLRSFVLDDAVADSRDAARIFSQFYELDQPGAKVEMRQGELTGLQAEKVSVKPDFALVDRVAAAISGVATIFERQGSDYVRVSTNVKKDGKRAVGTKLAADHPAQGALANGAAYFGPATLFGKSFMTGYVPVKNSGGQTIGVLFIGIPMDVYEARMQYLAWLAIAVGCGAVAVFGLAAYIAARRIVAPLSSLANCIDQVARGALNTSVPYLDKIDEFGRVARTIDVFRAGIAEKTKLEAEAMANADLMVQIQEQADQQKRSEDEKVNRAVELLAGALGRLAQGDLDCRIDIALEGRLETLRRDFNLSVERMGETLGGIQGATRAIHANTRMMSGAIDDLSRRTEQQAASLEETAAAVQEITQNVKGSAARVDEASRVIGLARTTADSSAPVVQNAVSSMTRIRDASDKISQIIDVIDSIAFQTNLLALNAGVEAARAGEAGKGFAVVAQEVRELAQRSAKAAKEIGDLITNSAQEVSTGSHFVEQTGEALIEISRQIVDIAGHVQVISGVAREQSSSLQEINASVTAMDQMTQQNAAMVEETNAATQHLAEEADQLMTMIEKFNIRKSSKSDVTASKYAA
ncbi:methyl-accepting chemotaxis protein [Rhizobium sp. SG_E_25_P2]|uniref:methyl-accepting chemotaxis protein n=1 Tax=Rhizobium sp. SG_E_25_P2 TaxID=2879942 RepID=UPI002473DF3C|nr:methyl-accepting chemotaxis protein [Rhizobium sp. SG_E_25_P2]MDH6266486.1 methyl-accepting chemotaxis protein [Rhizobium sp. SG_E_25_P2]